DLILSGRPKQLRAAFGECEIVTQVSYDFGRPDIRIVSRTRSDLKIFVEVKIRAKEGHNQIERYGKNDYVALLAPQLLDVHEGKNFLGHFFWYQVYSLINSSKRKNEIHRQFLKYLEARNMGPSKPISKKDLRRA